MSVEHGRPAAGARVPPLFEPPSFLRLNLWQALVAGLIFAAAIGVSAYLGSRHYPTASPPDASELERRIAAVFGDPTVQGADGRVVGDLLVERFYILDLLTGERYVADFLKGKIQSIQTVASEGFGTSYVFLLDMKNQRRDRAVLSAFVSTVSHPEKAGPGYYLGLITPAGISDAFALNYSGYLPARRSEFRGPEDEDLRAFLLRQDYQKVTAQPSVIPVDGYNFLLSTSDAFPLFKNEFGLSRAIFVSELIVVDATSRAHRAILYRLQDSYAGGPAR